jgi:hypothetical protein
MLGPQISSVSVPPEVTISRLLSMPLLCKTLSHPGYEEDAEPTLNPFSRRRTLRLWLCHHDTAKQDHHAPS